MIGIIIVAAVILVGNLLINMIVANSFSEIAEYKGYHSSKYKFFPFLFGLPGWLMVVALPNKKDEELKILIQQNKELNHRVHDILNILLPTQENIDTTSSKLMLEEAKAELQKYKYLLEDGSISREEYEAVKRQLVNAIKKNGVHGQ